MKTLRKRYLYSDMDNTLIADDKRISNENIDAIRRFIEAGGRFSVASGRNVDITRPFLGRLPVNAPAILLNGAAVYDFGEERYLRKVFLPPKLAADILRTALSVYPGGCPQSFHEGPIRLYNPSGVMDHYIAGERQPHTFAALGETCPDAFKVMMYGERDSLERCREAVLAAHGGERFRWTYSSAFYLEFLPPEATKGAALEWIEENLGFERAQTAAVGDYFNDVEMLAAASLGAAVANAPEAVRAAADVVVRDNNHHAVADLIDRWLLAG